MKNLKIVVVIFATFNIGLTNTILGGGNSITGTAASQQAQNLVAQFTNQYQGQIMDPNIDMAPNINYLKDVLNVLYANQFTADITDPTVKSSLATTIWNAMIPTVNNYARYQKQMPESQYKTRVWNLLNSLLSELINTTFKDINQKIQASKKTPAARPVPAQQQPQRQPAAQQNQTIATSLSDIRNGSFGNDYAKKVKEIASFDYSKATKVGFEDLNTILTKSVDQINANKSLQSAAKMENIKKTIDSLHEDLSKYHDLKPTTGPVKTTPSMVFTLDLILKGALGGAYAKKAQEISSFDYTQSTQVGFPSLSGVLQQDIARINADKSAQSTKVANLKKSIDSLHQDLNKYRTIKLIEPTTAAPVGTPAKQPLPNWISDDNALKNKEFETALLNYIFKNQDASEKDIRKYFSQQVPKNLPGRSNLINAMNKSIKNNFGDAQKRASRKSIAQPTKTTTSTTTPKTTTTIPKTTTATTTTTTTAKPRTSTQVPSQRLSLSSQLVSELPEWVNKNSFEIDQKKFNRAVGKYVISNIDADDEDIIEHFSNQIPAGMAKGVKDMFINGIQSALIQFYRQSGSSQSKTTPKTTTTTRTSTPTTTTNKPMPKGTFGLPSAEIVKRLPAWISSSRNTYELNVDDFKLVLAQYIAKNKNAQDKDIIQYFAAQIPVEFPFRNDVIDSMKNVLATQGGRSSIARESWTPRGPTFGVPVAQIVEKLPQWISRENNYDLNRDDFKLVLTKYISQNKNATDENIIQHFATQIPSETEFPFRDDVIKSMRSVLKDFRTQSASSSTVSSASTRTSTVATPSLAAAKTTTQAATKDAPFPVQIKNFVSKNENSILTALRANNESQLMDLFFDFMIAMRAKFKGQKDLENRLVVGIKNSISYLPSFKNMAREKMDLIDKALLAAKQMLD